MGAVIGALYSTPPLIQSIDSNPVRAWINGQLSKATRRAYSQELIAFYSWLSGIKSERVEDVLPDPLCNVGVQHIVEYRNHLSESKAPATVARSLSALKSLYKYLFSMNLTDRNPTEWVKLPKVPQESDTIALNQTQIESLINAVEKGKNPLKKHRDRLILLLLFMNGLRRSEVCKIKLSDFDQIGEFNILRVKSKGGKVEITKIKPIIKTALDSYLDELKASGIVVEKEEYLFRNLSNNGRISTETGGISSHAIYLIMKAYAKLAGLPENIVERLHPHSARHSAITIVVDHAGVHKAMQFARHSDPKTTMRYYRRKNDIVEHGVDYINYSLCG